MTEPTDLFGNPMGSQQLSLFGGAEDRLQAPMRTFEPDPPVVRMRLHALLDRARRSQVMPWPERDARMWQVVFPQMASWLPEEEAEQLRFDFAVEIERLKAA